jgi:hypothetical protein
VSPRGLGDSIRKEKIALRSTAAPIRDSELERGICAVFGCRPGTMFVDRIFPPCNSVYLEREMALVRYGIAACDEADMQCQQLDLHLLLSFVKRFRPDKMVFCIVANGSITEAPTSWNI